MIMNAVLAAPLGATPRALIDHSAAQLARFGYAPFADAGAEPDWSHMWDCLKADFSSRHRPDVPSWGNLPVRPRAAARIYIRRRLFADRLFEDCQLAYLQLHEQGIGTELVEAYTLARDAYEEAVFQFGDARAVLDELLLKNLAD